ncbi:pro-FMRFamide-related neuropeptide FF [Gallus gallus]|uniref:Neuropeptide FF-amide peptide n=1 Tax=Gallus gallus TaxID=9031 RepID=A0A0C4JZ93_CHICK|nr:pro-FMRFamide-related neuropeptide FF [Gallus gallus]XP_040549914.1 pro-FMRFamide-related neuropeptide FF [Gallus gallus]AHC55375.1 neuropeptide FF-amide peptide precursor [Gallus gallus]|eukprot:XP_015155812.1 pro-FMRFamide-related neuropeptide FF [Gallus gallus]
MAARAVLALLLLLLGADRTARACPDPPRPDPLPGGPGAAAPSGPSALSALLRSMGRSRHGAAPELQPQRFPRGPGAPSWLSPRSWDPPSAPFWTMATPQRFGRRR